MNFIKYAWLYTLISSVLILSGMFSLVRYGVKPSIDFVGGSLLEIAVVTGNVSNEQVTSAVEGVYNSNSVQQTGEGRFLIKGETIDNTKKNEVITALTLGLQSPIQELRFETIGPTLSKELLSKTLVAVAIVSVIITLYVARQFSELKYGVAAVLAMFHDAMILIGSFSILGVLYGVEVDVLFVTALLTTLSFSVHDTIVVFDRIRELRHKHPRAEYTTLLDAAITETLSRSINNSMTIIIMLLALSLLGGDTVRWFSIALLIGSITGTYSSPFVAVPLLLAWDKVVKRKPRRV